MQRTETILMRLGAALLAVFCAASVLRAQAFGANAAAAQVTVDCNRGQSLNRALAGLDKNVAATVLVKGTCVEAVDVRGFEGLTLNGSGKATLEAPNQTTDVVRGVLTISASRSVTIDGLRVFGGSGQFEGVVIFDGSADVRLRNMTVENGRHYGIIVTGRSNASLARLTVREPAGWAAVGIYDGSVVHIEDSLIENSNPDVWHAGIDTDGAVVAILHGITIRNWAVPLSVRGNSAIKIYDNTDFFPPGGQVDVVIENPDGNYVSSAVVVASSSMLSLGAPLRIVRPVRRMGMREAGLKVNGGSICLCGGRNLVIEDSQGQGVLVEGHSQANLVGATITGAVGNGVVAVDHSTVMLGSANDPDTIISGSLVNDLFCDGTSSIFGLQNAPTGVKVNCDNVQMGGFPPIP